MRTTLLPAVSLALLALVSVSAAGCGGGAADAAAPTTPKASTPGDKAAAPPLPTKPDSDKVTWKKDATFASCHNDVKTGADLAAGVAAMGAGCATLMKMHKVGQTTLGSRQNLDPAQSIPLHVEANHCYRVFGLSEDSLKDLDIAVIDSAGKSAGEDGSDSPDAVVLEDGELCFTQADDVKVNIAAGSGGGKYAVEIWSD